MFFICKTWLLLYYLVSLIFLPRLNQESTSRALNLHLTLSPTSFNTLTIYFQCPFFNVQFLIVSVSFLAVFRYLVKMLTI